MADEEVKAPAATGDPAKAAPPAAPALDPAMAAQRTAFGQGKPPPPGGFPAMVNPTAMPGGGFINPNADPALVDKLQSMRPSAGPDIAGRQAAFAGGFGGGAAPPPGLAPQTLPPITGARPVNPMPGYGQPGMRSPASAWGRPMAPKVGTPWGAGRYPIR